MTEKEHAELSELGQAALGYVNAGFAVFPLVPRTKRPFPATAGLNQWTDNPQNVIDHWTKVEPNSNIGITCGSPSGGLLVLDFDVDEEKDKDGLATLIEWEKSYGELPETAVAITGSGGMHYFYRTDRTNIHPSTNSELGVDVRCDGSYIVAPPSIHPNGRRYEWQDPPDEVPIALATGAVYDFLDHVQRNGGQDETKKPNGKFQLPEKIKEGERDDVLFKYASHLRAIGRSDAEILNAVAGANAMRCDPPMGRSDIQRIAKSACRYEQGESADGAPAVGRPGTKAGGGSGFEGPRGGIRTNDLAKAVMQRNYARLIDGAPAVWTGSRWEFGTRAINRCVLELADDAKKQDKAEVASYVMDKAPRVSSDTSFDGRYYVQFSNCTYDVMSDELVEPHPSMYIVTTLPVELNLEEPPNEADEFIRSVAGDDPATETALREIIGAVICSRRVLSQSPMLIGRAGGAEGKASNGKSSYLNWLRSIAGTENVSSLDIATLGQRFQAGRIVGKAANLGDDIPDGFLRGEELSLFKKLVTGDAIYTDVKNGEGFEFRPSAALVFSMNAVPRLADTTDGVFRRLAFIPFRRRFAPGLPGYDPDIMAKLTKPEVLRRGALLGLMALQPLIQRGVLCPIPDMAAEVEEVKQDNDSVARWLYDNDITAIDIDRRAVTAVYQEYSEWCRESGERNPCAIRTFSARVRESPKFGTTVATETRRFDGRNKKAFIVNC